MGKSQADRQSPVTDFVLLPVVEQKHDRLSVARKCFFKIYLLLILWHHRIVQSDIRRSAKRSTTLRGSQP